MAEQGIITDLRQRFNAWWNGERDYRFESEQANHEDQRRQTETSLGLMAAAATHGDDEHRLQAMQTESTMLDRRRVLVGKRHTVLSRLTLQRRPGLSQAERWELASIERSLAELWAPKATPEDIGDQRLSEFGAVGQPRSFLGPLAPASLALGAVRPWMLWTGAIAAVGVWGAYNDVRAGRLENERNEALATVESLEREVMATSAERDMLRDAAVQADAQSQQAAQTIEAERARRLRAEREARRIRDAMEQARAGNDVDYGFGGVRNDQPPQ